MQWLNNQRLSMKLCNTVPDGFPPISGTGGNATRGSDIFVQKCAVCHRRDGQGRYRMVTSAPRFGARNRLISRRESRRRRRTWRSSYDGTCRLMAAGELADQEAWDAEAYIRSPPRPSSMPARKRY